MSTTNTNKSSHDCPQTGAVLLGNEIIRGCELCLDSYAQSGDSAKFDREYQKKQYRDLLVQPNEPRSFVRAHGAEMARKNGYTDEQIRKYS